MSVAEKDRAKTAFCTPFGPFEFQRMPFGFCNAPGTFQQLMERIFGDQCYHSLLLYLDDVVIFSTFQDKRSNIRNCSPRVQMYRVPCTLLPGSREEVSQLLLPQQLQAEVLTALHDDHGH